MAFSRNRKGCSFFLNFPLGVDWYKESACITVIELESAKRHRGHSHLIGATLRTGSEKRSRCTMELLPLSTANSHDWCATSSSSLHTKKKKRVTLSQWNVTTCQDIFWEEWLNCLFQCCLVNSSAILNCSWQPAVLALRAVARLNFIFGASLPLINNENPQRRMWEQN